MPSGPMLSSLTLAPELQPDDRPAAPDELALVQAFANSFYDLERRRWEQLTSPAALGRWLARRGLLAPKRPLDAEDLRRALDVREGIRTLLGANNGQEPDRPAIERLNQALDGVGLRMRLDADAPPELLAAAPARGLDVALGLIVWAVAVAQLRGHFDRLKVCPGRDCGWAFYDSSRNQTGTWCSMSICGSREKAREYRARRSRVK